MRADIERRQAAQRVASLQLTRRQRSGRRPARCAAPPSARGGARRLGVRGAALQRRAAALPRRALDDLPRDAGPARSAAGAGEPAAGDARLPVGTCRFRGTAAGAGSSAWRPARAAGVRCGAGAANDAARAVPDRDERVVLKNSRFISLRTQVPRGCRAHSADSARQVSAHPDR